VEQKNIALIEHKFKRVGDIISTYVSKDNKVLILGHGEEIYIPSRIASYVNADVYFKTTTRSPIYCDGKIIHDKSYFVYDDVKYFIYNKEELEKNYDKVIFISESDAIRKITSNTIEIKL